MPLVEKQNSIPAFYAKDRKQWREWLQKNHENEKSVWLILYSQKSKIPAIDYSAAVEEALCFGWIDSKALKRDDESHYQYFSKRKPGSGWSKLNRERVERMIREGRMAPVGQAIVDLAKKSGAWDAFIDVENSVIPDDLKKQFDKNKRAFDNFNAFAPSARRIILAWIQNAKKAETRKQRIEKTVALAAQNLKSYP
ncbi:MAG TPA: YdeI/OmpD-associated family protein [Chryseosolibacter sp.]